MAKAKQTANPLPDLSAMQVENIDRLNLLGAAFVENIGRMNSELLRFVGERLQEDLKTQHALMQCRDVTKLSEIQSEFLKRSFEQYSTETAKMVQMGLEIVENTLKAGSGKS